MSTKTAALLKRIAEHRPLRPSPRESATSFDVGTRKRGGNGKMWVVVETSNGVRRWTRATSPSAKNVVKPRPITKPIVIKGDGDRMKSYLIHDNGGRPFKVYIITDHNESKRVEIYANTTDWSKVKPMTLWKDIPVKFEKLVKVYSDVKRVFIGRSPLNPSTSFSGGHGPKFDGNSILVNIAGNRYVSIGYKIEEFTSPEPIERYWSSVGNNDVPYPVAKSKSYAYFMLDMTYVPIERFESIQGSVDRTTHWSDLYHEYYGHYLKDPARRNYTKTVLKPRKLTNIKLIHDRILE